MTAGHPAGQSQRHTPLAWGAVGLTSAAAVLVALGIAGLGGAGAGVVLSVAAFVAAVVAKARHEQWALLWFPLLLAPALLVSAPFWV